VGKSWLTTALCAWLRQQEVRVAPFKAQNMSNNAWVTLDDGEMSRAQAVQAEACGLRAIVEMNPILLKPSGDGRAQLVLRGVAQGHLAARDYYAHHERLWTVVAECLDYWRTHCDVLVLEGAGSPVELNLMARDLVNLRPLRHLDARWLLVGDIDRGGIYAQLAGTWALLPPDDPIALSRGHRQPLPRRPQLVPRSHNLARAARARAAGARHGPAATRPPARGRGRSRCRGRRSGHRRHARVDPAAACG